MAFQHQHKRSSEKNRRPRPSDLIDGQLAVNFNSDTPGIYFKDNNGGLVSIGPVHIGAVEVPLNFASHSPGEMAYDPDTGLLQVWTGETWQGIANSAYVNGTGSDGKSAYEVALDNGFVGTEQDWLNSLVPSVEEIDADVVALNAALGISEDDTTFGTFTSPYLADNQDLKYVLEGIGNAITQRVTTVNQELGLRAYSDSATLTGIPTAPTAPVSTNTTQIATTEFVSTAVANLLDAAPGALDTLNEIAAAINDDPDVFTNLTANIAAVQSDVDQNEADVDAAIATLQADVDQNELDADAADAALSGRLDTLEADTTTATAVAAVQADVDQNEADADAAIAELNTDVTDLNTAIGITENDQDLGTFTGSTIADNVSVKAALQTLETTLEAVDIDTDDLAALTGIAENVTNLGTFTGSTISDNLAVKAALQEVETALEATQADVDQNESDADTAIALKADIDDPTFTTKISSPEFHSTSGDHLKFRGDTNDIIFYPNYTETLQITRSGTDCRFTSNGGTGTFKFNQETDLAGGMKLGGVAITTDGTELNYVDGVTSSIQTQLDAIQADVDQNESDADTAIALKANIASPTFTGTVGGITKAMVGLGDVDNTSDADKPVSTAQQTAIDAVQADVDQNESDADAALALKADLASPTFTGTPAAPTASAGTNTTQVATTAFVTGAVSDLVDGAPGAIDTLNELAAALGDDANFSTTVTNLITANEVHIDNAVTLTGVAKDATNLGTFTGSTIADDQTIKASLQALETKVEAVQTDVDGNETDADAAIAANEVHIDNIVTLSGVAKDAEHLGTFTGSTIADDQTIKASLQALETALEGHIPVLVEVHNQTGGDLTKGDVVYVNGTHSSGKPTVALADANGSSTYPALGLIYATVADGVDGLVIISGFLDGIDTDTPSWDAGDALYLSETAGDLTKTRPTASGTKVQKVAMSARRHATAGSVIVIGAGRTNDVPNELIALTGVAHNATNLGTFSGSTISDNEDVKTALQELETAHEALPRMLHASWDASTAGSFDWANDEIASRGISGVTRQAVGIYRVTFTTAFADTNYSVTTGVGSTDYSGTGASPREVSVLTRNAAYVDVICERTDDAVNEDNFYMSVMIML